METGDHLPEVGDSSLSQTYPAMKATFYFTAKGNTILLLPFRQLPKECSLLGEIEAAGEPDATPEFGWDMNGGV